MTQTDEAVAYKPQTQLVLDYLQSGRTLTTLIALTNLGVGSLTTRIAELRNAGIAVIDEWGVDHFDRRYKRYWIAVEQAKAGGFGRA